MQSCRNRSGDDDGSPEAAPAAANAATGWAGALLQMLSPAKPPGADNSDSQLADRLLSADARGLHGNNTAGGGDDIEGNGGGASPLLSPEQLQGLRRYGLLNGIQVPFPRPLFSPYLGPYLGPYILNGIQVPVSRPYFGP